MTLRKFLAMIIALAISVSFCSCSTEKTVIPTSANPDNNSDFKSVFSELSGAVLNKLEEDQENQTKFGTFVVLSYTNLGNGLKQYILYDSITTVMYSYVEGPTGGGFSELYNADGTLRLYSPEDRDETE